MEKKRKEEGEKKDVWELHLTSWNQLILSSDTLCCGESLAQVN